MAACGVDGAHDLWMLREPFEDWLAAHPAKGGDDLEPGTVLVWRSADGNVQHAAVTIGAGWALHKPSQGWMSPTKILTGQGLKYSARTRGQHLHRRRLR
jgi:cell wall-associated NlpC family hydrolase